MPEYSVFDLKPFYADFLEVISEFFGTTSDVVEKALRFIKGVFDGCI